MYGFWVHACIDGGSNFVVYAVLALNKQGATLRDAFDAATAAYGYPLRLRADMAFEATFVGQRMRPWCVFDRTFHCKSGMLRRSMSQ